MNAAPVPPSLRLHTRLAELGKQVRRDDERDRDRTKTATEIRSGPGR